MKQLLPEGTIGAVTDMSINNEFPTSHRLDLVHYLLGDAEAVRFIPGTTRGYRFERMTGRKSTVILDALGEADADTEGEWKPVRY